MKQISDIATPAFLVDMEKLHKNIQTMASLCRKAKKQLWPMVKTHKSTAIAAMQKAAGVDGFLVGTIDEAEALADSGFSPITLAYPVAGEANVRRVVKLALRTRVIVSLDGVEAAQQLNAVLPDTAAVDYLLLIDSGLHRFGVPPQDAPHLARKLKCLQRLRLIGIATHPGQVYSASSPADVKQAAVDELRALKTAKAALSASGIPVSMVATGSTPTASLVMNDPDITAIRPGNYVFNDAIQVALKAALPEDCSLSVLATVISMPRSDLLIVDSGSKCLGLDKGAHGSALVDGYGLVKGHPELTVVGLSEEVAKVKVSGRTNLTVGDRLEIIPNHACSAANLAPYLIGHHHGWIAQILPVDAKRKHSSIIHEL